MLGALQVKGQGRRLGPTGPRRRCCWVASPTLPLHVKLWEATTRVATLQLFTCFTSGVQGPIKKPAVHILSKKFLFSFPRGLSLELLPVGS